MHYKRQREGRPLGGPAPLKQPRGTICKVPGCGRPHKAYGYCKSHWARIERTGDARPDDPIGTFHFDRDRTDGPLPLAAVREFWTLVERGSGCWLWTGSLSPDGYGIFRGRLAHRLVLILVGEAAPQNRLVDHRCHGEDKSCPGGKTCLHRRCVRPDHLEPVTSGENTRRGRARLATAQPLM